MESNQVIFKYSIADAFALDSTVVTITDRLLNNLEVEHKTRGEKVVKRSYHLNIMEIEYVKILVKNFINEVGEGFEIEPAPVLDGTLHDFDMQVKDKKFEFSVDNLWYYEQGENVNANKLLNIFYKIRVLVIQNGVRDDEFTLNM